MKLIPAVPALSQTLPRRLFRAVLLMLVLGVFNGAASAATGQCKTTGRSGDMPRLVTTDWMLLETLIAIGAKPVGAASLQAFGRWVGTTPPPSSVTELGLRAQPNLALLSQIEPDRIVLSQRYRMLKRRLSRIAPVTLISTYLRPGPVWSGLLAATREVAALACRSAAGERLIRRVTQKLRQVRQKLPDDTRPLLIIQFVDQQHVRVYGKGSLYDAVLNQLGLTNAWSGGTNPWGYALVGIAALMRPQIRAARIIVVEPLPVGLGAQLAHNGLWQHLPAMRHDKVLIIPEVWSFGGLPSGRRFARLIKQALTRPQAHAFNPGASAPARS